MAYLFKFYYSGSSILVYIQRCKILLYRILKCKIKIIYFRKVLNLSQGEDFKNIGISFTMIALL